MSINNLYVYSDIIRHACKYGYISMLEWLCTNIKGIRYIIMKNRSRKYIKMLPFRVGKHFHIFFRNLINFNKKKIEY